MGPHRQCHSRQRWRRRWLRRRQPHPAAAAEAEARRTHPVATVPAADAPPPVLAAAAAAATRLWGRRRWRRRRRQRRRRAAAEVPADCGVCGCGGDGGGGGGSTPLQLTLLPLLPPSQCWRRLRCCGCKVTAAIEAALPHHGSLSHLCRRRKQAIRGGTDCGCRPRCRIHYGAESAVCRLMPYPARPHVCEFQTFLFRDGSHTCEF